MLKMFLFLLLIPFNLMSQQVDNSEKSIILNSLIKLIDEKFISVEYIKSLRDSITSERYISIIERKLFIRQLNIDLYKITKDRHLTVEFDPKRALIISGKIKGENSLKQQKEENFGFEKVQVLAGNIGYFKLNYFSDTAYTKKQIASVFEILKNTDIIVIDLRNNFGGNKIMMQLLASYILPKQTQPLITITGKNGEQFTGNAIKIAGNQALTKKGIYLLTSTATFSAAEGFAFILKNRKRVTIFGEKTAGAGNSVGFYSVADKYVIGIPEGKAIDPITGTGWEQTGVQPDSAILSEVAFEKAYLTALQQKQKSETDSIGLNKIQWKMDELNSIINPVTLNEKHLINYTGVFGKRIVHAGEGRLWYQARDGAEQAELIPISETLFRFREIDYFRILFKKDSKGNIVGLSGIFSNGTNSYNEKSE